MPQSIPGHKKATTNTAATARHGCRIRTIGILLRVVAVVTLYTIGLTPNAFAQETPQQQQTFEESITDMGTPTEFFAAHPDERMNVFEHTRPDLDADGVGDLIFPMRPNAENPVGTVSVMSRWTMDDLYTVSSGEENDGFGMVTLGAKNLFGDDSPSLIVAAPLSSAAAPLGGRVYIYDGRTGGLQWTITGTTERGGFGFSVAVADDVNGDGLGDLLIGAPADGPGTTGRAYVFYGRPVGEDPVHLTTDEADMIFNDGEDGSSFGFSVAGGGDITGDGRPELLVGAVTAGGDAAPKAGAAHIFSGATGERLATIVGRGAGAALGTSILGNVDITGDGRSDILVGAPDMPKFEDINGGRIVSDGRALLFTSESLGALAPGAALTEDDADVVIQPAGIAESMFASSIQRGNDVDDDGVPDILIGSSFYVEVLDPLETEPEPEQRAFLIHDMTHVYSGATGLLRYSFETDRGSGREILVPFVPPPGAEAEPQAALFGDVDENLVVESLDVTLVMGDIGTPDETGDLSTDVNGDGVVDAWDAVNVMMYVDEGTALAMADSLLAPEDCVDEFGVELQTCECIVLVDTVVNPEDLDCDDGSGGGPGPVPGPGPGPGPQNCDDLPRTTEAECEAWAACQAGDKWDDIINSHLQSAAQRNAEADALEAEAAEARVTADAALNVIETETKPAVHISRKRAMAAIDICEATMLNNIGKGLAGDILTGILAGGAGGAVTGAGLGSVIPGGGTISGAVIGAFGGGFGGGLTSFILFRQAARTAGGIQAAMNAQRVQLDFLFITGAGQPPAGCLSLPLMTQVHQAAVAHNAAWDAWEDAEAVVTQKHEASMSKRQDAQGFEALAIAAQDLREEDEEQFKQECMMEINP